MNNTTSTHTILDLLDHHVLSQPDQIAYTYLVDGELTEIHITYAQLAAEAQAIAAQLQQHVAAGERALLLYPPGLSFVSAFLGCLYANVIAVPAYPPHPRRPATRIQAIASDAQPKIILSTEETFSKAGKRLTEYPEMERLVQLATDSVEPSLAQMWQPSPIDSQDLAFLQYTSGSTSTPKGVMVSHGNILYNAEMMKVGLGHSDETIIVNWLPVFHDMGLIGNVLEALYLGVPCTIMSPVDFIQKPIRWLQAISRTRATMSGAPNFAYDLCVDQITPEQCTDLDLSSWKTAFNGAEPIHHTTVERFTEKFQPYGFRPGAYFPCYGMAETTLYVSGSPPLSLPVIRHVQAAELEQDRVVLVDGPPEEDQAGNIRTIVSCGVGCLDQEVQIVDPVTCLPLPDAQVGEIWISGDHIAQGYWNRAEATEETFNAYTTKDGSLEKEDGPYLRTGDLGFMLENEVYVTGRLKDLIIIRGRNHYPQDIERTVGQCHPALFANSSAAFTVESDLGEQLVIVQEVERTYLRKLDSEEVFRTIRRAVADEHELRVHAIVLIKPGSIQKTSSGKIQRRATRLSYQEEALKVVAQWQEEQVAELQGSKVAELQSGKVAESVPTTNNQQPIASNQPSTIQTWLRIQIAQHLKIDPNTLDSRTPLAEYGLDSVMAVQIAQQLEDWLKPVESLDPTLLWSYPTIDAIAQHLSTLAVVAKAEPASIITSETTHDEPIAIIGMDCRLPGGVQDPTAYWELLRDGRDAISQVPADRWPIDAYYDPDPNQSGKIYTRYGGFIDQVDQFDPGFFGLSPREAQAMDPQQRLLLEVSHAALEQAGQAPAQLQGSRTGVFMGIGADDYGQFNFAASDPTTIDMYNSLGNNRGVAAGRIAYLLGLQGPAMQLDTTCSSSLLAVHLACQSLRTGESNLALAGGINLMLTPRATIALCKLNALAPDGRCKTFDAAADGYVRGEGCGVVVLKRLSDAMADGDRIRVVIRASAVNHDGRSNGLTAPNGLAQEELLTNILKKGEVEASQIQYIETHGTGTSLGDPIEVRALGNVLADGHTKENPLYLGAVKSNIGHLEAAAGIAGLMKCVLALQHGEIPQNLHFENPNPYISWETLPIQIPTEHTPWPAPSGERLAGISSFGMSGTNVHLLVGDFINSHPVEEETRPLHIAAISAKEEEALSEIAQRHADYLTLHPTTNLTDFCFTLNTGRSHYDHRLALTANTAEELVEKLSDTNNQQPTTNNQQPITNPAFLFTGQGAQYVGMGRALYDSHPHFREIMAQCDAILQPILGVSLPTILYPAADGNSDLIHKTAYTQPALFALEYALAQLWLSWGVQPSFLMGHSVGEYVAACVAGVFSLEDGLKLIAARARLMQALPENGAMVAIMASEDQVLQELEPYTDKVSIAAINGPKHIVISGEAESVQQLVDRFSQRDIRTVPLEVSHAFHSPLMEPMLAEFATIASQISYHPPLLPLISNLDGQPVTDAIATPDYWVQHVRQPVNFMAGLTALHAQNVDVLIEIGPKPTLLGMAAQAFDKLTSGHDTPLMLPSLHHKQEAWSQLLQSLGTLYERGVEIDWHAFEAAYDKPRQKLALPTYPYQRQRYWQMNQPAAATIQRKSNQGHPLLGAKLQLAGVPSHHYQAEISAVVPAYLQDHQVFGDVILPAAAYMELMLTAAAQARTLDNGASIFLDTLTIQQPLRLNERYPTTLQVTLTPSEDNGHQAQIFSLVADDSAENPTWLCHATGTVNVTSSEGRAVPPPIDLAAEQNRCANTLPVEVLHGNLEKLNIRYGPAFQGLQKVWQSGQNHALGQIVLPEILQQEAGNYHLHPALLDAALQVIAAAFRSEELDAAYLPSGLDKLHFYQKPDNEIWVAVTLHPAGQDALKRHADVTLCNNDGQIVAELHQLSLQRAYASQKTDTQWQEWLYQINWRPQAQFGGQRSAVSGQLSAVSSHPSSFALHPLAELESLSITYILNALEQLGWRFQPGQHFTTEEMARSLGVTNDHQHLFKRLLNILTEVDILHIHYNDQGEYWESWAVPTILEADLHWRPIAERHPEAAAELAILSRCGEQLATVLQGKTDPLQLLFPDGDTTLTTNLYQDSSSVAPMNRLVQQTVNELLENLPAHRGVKILEIGAGTGGTTAHLLPHLPANQVHYTFTDVASLFLLKAREKFSEYNFMDYQLLDIEKPSAEQDIEPHSYDIVIAANVIHATLDLRQTLQNARQLLRPGGQLIILEATQPQRWLDLTFGLLDGWWRFEDTELRLDYPLLSVEQWQDVLTQEGFQQINTLNAEAEAPQAVIVAETAEVQAPAAQDHWLILADQSGVGQSLAEKLDQQGATATLVEQVAGGKWQVTVDDVQQIQSADFPLLLSSLGIQTLHGVINLWSLDVEQNDMVTEGALDQASKACSYQALELVQALINSSAATPPKLWLVTRGAQTVHTDETTLAGLTQSPLWGLGKVIALEHPELNSIRIDLQPSAFSLQPSEADAAVLLDEISTASDEDQVAFRDGKRYVARLGHYDLPQLATVSNAELLATDEPCRLDISTKGVLDNLTFRPIERQQPMGNEIEIAVRATGLNFRDVLNALDLYPGDPGPLGFECAGEVVAVGASVKHFQIGDRVMGIAPGSFAQYVTINTDLMIAQPSGLNFEEAATIPIAFLTAHYALHSLAKLQSGERVLIHAAAGGVGQAAVQLAQAAGAEVFATASPEKWEILRTQNVARIMHSRTLDFADEISQQTEGQGVDVVLNSLTGDALAKSVDILSSRGRFLEIGKLDPWTPQQVRAIKPNASYFTIDLARMVEREPATIQSLLQKIIPNFENGTLQPLPYTSFPLANALDAFRTLQQAKNIGKIVVQGAEWQSGTVARLQGGDSATYLITGGMGGLGLLVAEWLVEQGAAHLVLVGRSGPTDEAQKEIAGLAAKGATITVKQADVTDRTAMAGLLQTIKEEHPPLRGVIHAVGVLADGPLANLSQAEFEQVLDPKVQGAWNLHTLTLDTELDFFVLFSSAVSLFGNAGQANHAAANTFLDRLAHTRRTMGLPGLSINWGAWSEIGAVAEREMGSQMAARGVGLISPEEGIATFEHLMTQALGADHTLAQIGVVPIEWSRFLAGSQQPFYADFIQMNGATADSQVEGQSSAILEQLEKANTGERPGLLLDHIRSQVAQVLGWSSGNAVSPKAGFFDIGMDSLTSVELRNRLQATLGQPLESTLAFDYPNVSSLADYLAQNVLKIDGMGNGNGSHPHEQPAINMDGNLDRPTPSSPEQDDLSDLEAEAMLLEKLEELNY